MRTQDTSVSAWRWNERQHRQHAKVLEISVFKSFLLLPTLWGDLLFCLCLLSHYKAFGGYYCRKMWMFQGWTSTLGRIISQGRRMFSSTSQSEGGGLAGHRSSHYYGTQPQGGTLWRGSQGKLSLCAVQQPHTCNLLTLHPKDELWELRLMSVHNPCAHIH